MRDKLEKGTVFRIFELNIRVCLEIYVHRVEVFVSEVYGWLCGFETLTVGVHEGEEVEEKREKEEGGGGRGVFGVRWRDGRLAEDLEGWIVDCVVID